MNYSKLKDICITTQGIQISKDKQINKFKEGYIKYLYIADFKGENEEKFVENVYPEKIVTENDLVMANTGSPGAVFKGSLDYEQVSADLLKVTKTKKTELLFLALFLRILKTGGRCASIVPDGVLFGSTGGHKSIRKEIVENHKLEAIISMPSGVFKPYAGVSTAIMIFTKTGTGGTDKVWFYDMKADGYSLDDKRNPVEDNDINDIVERFSNLDNEVNRKRTEKSFFVPVEEIRDNGYDLSINKYKEIEYEEVKYDSPQEIMLRIRELEMDITAGIEELAEMIGE